MVFPRVKPVEMIGPPGGIDQSENPRPNSIFDGVNLDISKGYWETRDGWYEVAADFLSTAGKAACITEYVPDPRYDGSHYYCLIAAGINTAGNAIVFRELQNSVESARSLGSTIVAYGTDEQTRYSHVKGIWRYMEGTDVKYAPVIVFSNGVHPPLIYHQKDGLGTIEELDAVDGGTDLTFLKTPPRGKYMAIHMERLFMMNVPGHSNRIQWTTSTPLIYPVNCFAAAHFLDIGDGEEEITGCISFRGSLIIFKENSIWVLSGDGIGSKWNLQQVDKTVGAINGHSILNMDDSILFLAKSGVYEWAGGKARNISHPALRFLWDRFNWGHVGHMVPCAIHDTTNERVFFSVSSASDACDSWLVYDLKQKAWNRWGAWLNQSYLLSPGAPAGLYPVPDWGFESKHWGPEPMVLFMLDRDLVSNVGIYDKYAYGGSAVFWFLQTQRYFQEDPQTKILRYIAADLKMIGDWELQIVPLTDGESMSAAFARHVGTKWNIIVSDANQQEHEVEGTSNFQAVEDGPVDAWYTPRVYKLLDSEILEVATDVDKIKFTSNKATSGMGGNVIVVQEDENPVRAIDMHDFASRIYDTGTYDDAVFEELNFKKFTVGHRVMGRSFALYMTNCRDKSVPICSKLVMKGWGLWVIPKGILRPVGDVVPGAVGRTGDPSNPSKQVS